MMQGVILLLVVLLDEYITILLLVVLLPVVVELLVVCCIVCFVGVILCNVGIIGGAGVVGVVDLLELQVFWLWLLCF